MKKIKQISIDEISKSTPDELSKYFAIDLDTYEMETVLQLSISDISNIIEAYRNHIETYIFFEIIEENEK